MIFRPATVSDVPEIMRVRFAVKENRLTDPSSVTAEDCIDFIENQGMAWVCEVAGKIAGFSMLNLKEHNVWALFIDPEFEGQGIGKKLLNDLVDYHFARSEALLWLGTMPGTRAASFYQRQGWTENGLNPPDEIRFEMSFKQWRSIRSSASSNV